MAPMDKVNELVAKVQKAAAPYMPYVEPAIHWGFIPAVILIGMYTTKPRPSIGQFFFVG
ncbi:MAG: translocase of mitochondrial outer membrane [Monoraphidium minutum]|nr:MAG: translocase of mitochondrial outer membrane [Monoraphidium minutum]